MVPAMASVRVAGGLAATLLLTLSSVVLAQAAPPAGPATDPAAPAADGKEVEMEEEPAVDPSGVEENPTDPITGEPVEEPGAPPPVRARRSGYPAQEVLRPITLPALTSEVGLDLRTLVGDFSVDFNLRGRFGITRQWQIGLGYNVGGLYDDGAKFRFNTGKAVELEVTYLVQDWIGARLAVPMYMDPFSVGVTVGAPVKFTFADRFSVSGLGDLISFKAYNFLPTVRFERPNEVNANLVNTNSITPDGAMRFVAVGAFQWKPMTALIGTFGAEFADFSNIDMQYPAKLGLQHTMGKKLDLAATVGWESLAVPVDSFGLTLTAQLRI